MRRRDAVPPYAGKIERSRPIRAGEGISGRGFSPAHGPIAILNGAAYPVRRVDERNRFARSPTGGEGRIRCARPTPPAPGHRPPGPNMSSPTTRTDLADLLHK